MSEKSDSKPGKPQQPRETIRKNDDGGFSRSTKIPPIQPPSMFVPITPAPPKNPTPSGKKPSGKSGK